MNILIPHSWLLEHLTTKATPEELQKYVSLCGPSIERIYDREGEKVYDIEVTTNRVDSMSVRGIAREAAVILQQFGMKATLKPLALTKPTPVPVAQRLPLPTIVSDPKLCRRVVCVVLKNVQRTPTPDWMAKRLRETDQNVHDSVIDITNYITHELGHPVHAFDYEALMEQSEGHIIITEAKKGKKFVTLDGNEFTTVGGEVVFENPRGEIIDLPAIKGTANTSISDRTKHVLLWIENLEPTKVRFASMTHAIRTVAAQLSEKNVDPHNALPTLLRGVQLYQELCGAEVASVVYDDFPGKRAPKPVAITLEKITEYLGVEVPLKTISTILESLECSVELKKAVLYVTPPTFRPDLTIPADIVEEIARVYGYHKLPSILMDTRIPTSKPEGVSFGLENRIKRFLAAIGWQELYTYSTVSETIAQASGLALDQHLKLANPLSDDRVYLRRSLVPSLEEVIAQNSQRKTLSVFEVAHIYQPQTGELPLQELHLALVSTQPLREVRGSVESLLQQLYIGQLSAIPDEKPSALYRQSATLQTTSEQGTPIALGTLGITRAGHCAVVLPMRALIQAAKTHPAYQPIPKASSVMEDLTFTLPETVRVGEVLQDVKASSALIDLVELKGVYQRNVTLSIQYLDRTSESSVPAETVQKLRKQLIELVTNKHYGTLVGAL